jgi:DNA-binding NarL/FixJ family response regulator
MHLGNFCFILTVTSLIHDDAVYHQKVQRGSTMRVLLAEDQPRVRFALRVLLEQQPGVEIVGEATSAQSLLTQIETAHPNLVLLGWELPGLAEIGSLVSLRQIYPGIYIIALSGRPEARRAALTAGADAFVSKTYPPEQLLAAIAGCGDSQSNV